MFQSFQADIECFHSQVFHCDFLFKCSRHLFCRIHFKLGDSVYVKESSSLILSHKKFFEKIIYSGKKEFTIFRKKKKIIRNQKLHFINNQ